MIARIVLIYAFAVAAGCGGSGDSSSQPSPQSKFLYASAYSNISGATFPGAIYAFRVDSATGAISPVSGSPFASATVAPGPIAITRNSKFLYSVDQVTSKLSAFVIHADGSLTAVPGTPIVTPELPEFLVAHPTADFLYAFGYQDNLMVFAIDAGTGALNLTSAVKLGSTNPPDSQAITFDGRYIYQASGAASQILGYSVNAATGALNPVPGNPLLLLPAATSFPGPTAVDPSGKFLYVGNAFSLMGFGEPLWAYSLDAASGALTAVPGSPFDVGGIQGSVAVDASGRYLIVEIAPKVPGNCLAVFSIDPETGSLTSVPGSPFARTCGSVAADPSIEYVYVGGYSSQSTIGGVFALSIDEATGALTPIGEVTLPGMNVAFIAMTH